MSDTRQGNKPLGNADNLLTVTSCAGSIDVAKTPNQKLSMEDKLASKMFLYGREIICFFLAFAFTALAALHTSSPKISKPPPAKPFFNQSSIVLDFYKGHLGAMVERVTEADYSFIMYYAPWDAESQTIRQEFEKVAHYYHSQIFFAAINCWHPGSECRAQYNKILSYPVLMLYPFKDSGIQYKGIKTAPYMIRFVHAVMNPITRITEKGHIPQLLGENDAVIVGFFNFTGVADSPGYGEFYKAALRFLERDPNRELMFAAVTTAGGNLLSLDIAKYPSMRLFMWNESLSYPEDREWTSTNIINWVSNSIHQPALWLQPPGIKALTLAPYLGGGPALVLFTPRNPLHNENYNYNLLREVGSRYFNCTDNRSVNDIASHLGEFRRSAVTRHSEKTNKCSEMLKAEVPSSVVFLGKRAIGGSFQRWINSSSSCGNLPPSQCRRSDGGERGQSVPADAAAAALSSINRGKRVCKNIEIFSVGRADFQNQENYQLSCQKNHNAFKKWRGFESKRVENKVAQSAADDPRSPSSVRRNFLQENCRKWLTGNRYHRPVFPRESPERPDANFTSSVCKSNKTLALIAIDSLHFFHFAEALGVNVLARRDQTAVVILDPAEESQYVLQEDFHRRALVQFINNYTDGLLQRTLRAGSATRFATRLKTRRTCGVRDGGQICLQELTTDTFADAVLDPLKDVLVMYHSPYCAFCTAVAHVYLTVAHYLSKMEHLSFVRIDGDNNDLPWEYNINRFPSILFFPARRKEDSTVFPFSLPITIPNLINFILANLNGDSRVEALVNICSVRTAELPDRCVSRVRYLCMDVIEQLLKEYRKLRRHFKFLDKRLFSSRRKIILLKMNHLRDIRLILGSTNDLAASQSKVRLIRTKFARYYSAVRSLDSHRRIDASASPPRRAGLETKRNQRTARDEL